MSKLTLKGFFVCHRCRSSCSNGEDGVGPYGPDRCPEAYFPRKQRIGCLGPWCDTPCHLQTEDSDLSQKHLIDLVMYLGTELNRHLITEPSQEGGDPV